MNTESMNYKIYKSYEDFINREDKNLNGFTIEFLHQIDGDVNLTDSIGCWNCIDCTECTNCVNCVRCSKCTNCNDCFFSNNLEEKSDCFFNEPVE